MYLYWIVYILGTHDDLNNIPELIGGGRWFAAGSDWSSKLNMPNSVGGGRWWSSRSECSSDVSKLKVYILDANTDLNYILEPIGEGRWWSDWS